SPATCAAEQCHLAKKVAAAQSCPAVRQYYLDSARGDHKHRVAAIPGADDPLVRDQQPRPEEAGERPAVSPAAARGHRELPDQLRGMQPEIERRQLGHHRAVRLVLALQILEHLLANQPFIIKIMKS